MLIYQNQSPRETSELFPQDNATTHKSLLSKPVVSDSGFELPILPILLSSVPQYEKHIPGNQYHNNDDVISAVHDFLFGQ